MRTLLHLGPAGRQFWTRTRHGWQPLSGEPDTRNPIWVVTDLAEESFAEIDIPRLYGRDRADLIARQLTTRFPDTPYRSRLHISHGGKLLDRLVPVRFTLFGITAAEKLNAEFDSLGISLAGLCPTSLLLTRIGQHKALPADLFIVLPSPGALRIVFLKNRIPILTRLAPIPDQVSAQAEEIIRTHRYLENVRTLQRGTKPPPVLILGKAGEFAAPLAAARLDLVDPPPPWNGKPPADWRVPLFDLAVREQPFGQLAPVARRTVYLARRLHQGALAAAAISLLAGLIAAGTNLLDIVDIRHDKELNQATAHRLNTQLAELEQRTAAFGVTPDLVRRTVALNDREIVSVPPLDRHLRLVGNALDGEANVRLASLEWRLLAANATPCAKQLTAGGTAAGAAANTAANAEPAAASGDGGAADGAERKVELAFEVMLPNTATPRGKVQSLRNISAQLGKIEGARLLLDPAAALSKGTLRGGSLSGDEDKSFSWCLTLPGTLASAPDKATTSEGKQQP